MVVYIFYIEKPMIENSNFYGGYKRAADDGNAVTLIKVNGLMRAAGKRVAQVMVCRNRTVIMPEGYVCIQ